MLMMRGSTSALINTSFRPHCTCFQGDLHRMPVLPFPELLGLKADPDMPLFDYASADPETLRTWRYAEAPAPSPVMLKDAAPLELRDAFSGHRKPHHAPRAVALPSTNEPASAAGHGHGNRHPARGGTADTGAEQQALVPPGGRRDRPGSEGGEGGFRKADSGPEGDQQAAAIANGPQDRQDTSSAGGSAAADMHAGAGGSRGDRDQLEERGQEGARGRCRRSARSVAHEKRFCWEAYSNMSEAQREVPEDAEHLVIDAGHVGNVSRFFNHACTPNVAVQNVLLPGAGSALLYCCAFFTLADVPAMTELRWDYNAGMGGEAPEGSVPCLCGSESCRTWLY
eukprot:jgi/Ulvmu1/9549/UM053_0038.1